ncbi:MAG: Hsp33 family molecular chaperone HslO [Caldilineaceae bacterium]|nr:Hsp33 family molecular chaperone HslO [Caldilineaceae bacterium]
MNDYLTRVLGREAGVRGIACVTTDLVSEAARRHGTSPAATAALGYGLTAAVLLGSLLKVQQRVALKVAGGGPLQKMITESDAYGHVRGYVNVPNVPAASAIRPEIVAETIGRGGKLTVVKDLKLKSLYESTVPLQTGFLDADLTYYLNQSEQTPSVVEIGVKVDANGHVEAAGGLLLQTLPGEETSTLERLSERLDDLPPLGEVLVDGRTPQDILAVLFRDVDFEWLEERPLEFKCGCSRKRSRQALQLLPAEDLHSLIAEGEAVVDCHFCHERYVFEREELQTLLAERE